jgi:hypothetical protein
MKNIFCVTILFKLDLEMAKTGEEESQINYIDALAAGDHGHFKNYTLNFS